MKIKLIFLLTFTYSFFSTNLLGSTYVIGIAGPFSGFDSAKGMQLLRGAKMAAKDINNNPRKYGFNVKLVYGDDSCNEERAVAVAAKLVSQKIKAVIGHVCSGPSIVASEVYSENNILQISPASTHPNFTDRGLQTVFRITGRDDIQGKTAGEFIVRKLKGKNIAIIHNKTLYGEGLANSVRETIINLDGNVTLFRGVNVEDNDLTKIVKIISSIGSDVVYYGGLHKQAAILIRQLRNGQSNAVFMSGDGLIDNSFGEIAGTFSNGTLMTYQPDLRRIPSAAGIIRKFQKKGFEPEGHTLSSYAALIIAAKALHKKQGNSLKAARYIKAKKGGFKTIIGRVKFDRKGDLKNAPYVIYNWIGGTYYEMLID